MPTPVFVFHLLELEFHLQSSSLKSFVFPYFFFLLDFSISPVEVIPMPADTGFLGEHDIALGSSESSTVSKGKWSPSGFAAT